MKQVGYPYRYYDTRLVSVTEPQNNPRTDGKCYIMRSVSDLKTILINANNNSVLIVGYKL